MAMGFTELFSLIMFVAQLVECYMVCMEPRVLCPVPWKPSVVMHVACVSSQHSRGGNLIIWKELSLRAASGPAVATRDIALTHLMLELRSEETHEGDSESQKTETSPLGAQCCFT